MPSSGGRYARYRLFQRHARLRCRFRRPGASPGDISCLRSRQSRHRVCLTRVFNWTCVGHCLTRRAEVVPTNYGCARARAKLTIYQPLAVEPLSYKQRPVIRHWINPTIDCTLGSARVLCHRTDTPAEPLRASDPRHSTPLACNIFEQFGLRRLPTEFGGQDSRTFDEGHHQVRRREHIRDPARRSLAIPSTGDG
jgi:hypothetical protein